MSPNPSAIKSEKEAFKERERMNAYDKGVKGFQNGGRELESHYQVKESYSKLNFIHYVIILSILVSLVTFTMFLILTYIPITKPYVMKFIDTLLVQ